MTYCTVVFVPAGREGRVEIGTTVLDAARGLGVDLDSVCGGRAICGHCQVQPGTGAFAKWGIEAGPDALSEPGPSERDADLARPLASGSRLACVATLQGDAIIDVPATSQVHRPVVRKSVALDELVVDPLVNLAYVELSPPDGTSVVGQLRAALRDQHGLDVGDVTPAALDALGSALAGDRRAATVALRRGSRDDAPRVVAVVPGFTDVACGIAVDVGSTTIAGHLCDLATGEVLASTGVMNPQIRFGEDLMSRVSYVMMNPGGAHDLTAAVRDALHSLTFDLCVGARVPRTQVFDMVIVGNPIMHHLVLGLDPTPLGTAPFELTTDEPVEIAASALGLELPFASAYFLPCIAGHVGADTTAAILSERPYRAEDTQLLVDIGTNAEIVLGSRSGGIFAASSPTGPAFEGAQISCGQRATVGAIERVRIDRTTLTPAVKVIGCDAWSDEDAFAADAPAVTGVCGSGIVSALAQLFLAGVMDADGRVGPGAADTPYVVPDDRTFAFVLFDDGTTRLTITQNDVRAVQLAKAALRAGIELLLDHAGRPELADIRLAGAFGAHLDPLDAMVLGLIPDAPLESVRAVGNAAGAGAVRALVSAEQRDEIVDVVRSVTKIETATEPRFQELFVAAMAFPHASAPTPFLEQLVTLPERRPAASGRRRSRS